MGTPDCTFNRKHKAAKMDDQKMMQGNKAPTVPKQ
jgi:hypothetical protein